MNQPRKTLPNRLRIIGGRWRGVPITLPSPVGGGGASSAELRPTPDRVRETLFNWLQPVMDGARCLDLFAGSGVLGIEALSRGASHVEFVEREANTARHLESTLRRLKVSLAAPGVEVGSQAMGAAGAAPETASGQVTASVRVREALQFLAGPPRVFDVVFLDPPYASGLLPPVCERLASRGWLASQALVYMECPADQPLPPLPAGWSVHRTKRAGQVGYHLLRSAA
jgi:16S rRNA (guanine966-N2)-methyltransferase